MKKTVFLLFTFWAFAVSLTVNADPAYYLIGQFNEWDQNATVPFVLQDDGSFVLTQTFSGLFKVKNENGDWLGGQANNQGGDQCVLTYDNPSADLIDGANFFIDGSYAEYTLTIANGKLTVAGLPEPAYYLYAEEFNNWQDPIPFTKLKDGSFTLSRVFKGKFKVVDEYGHWYGGNTPDGSDYWLTQENPRATLSTSGSNMYLDGEAAVYTLTITDGVLFCGTAHTPQILNPGEWYDYEPYQWPDGNYTVASGWLYFDSYGMDIMGNLVAEDYNIEIDECWTQPLSYVKLEPSKYSYSIYTDYNKPFVFDPEAYAEFTEPTTEVFIFTILPPTASGWGSTSNFEYWGPHFPNLTNKVEGTDWEPFFKYRIGVQAHYTVDGVKTSSEIAWLGDTPPTIKGDVNFDGKVDVTDVNILVNIILGKDSADKYDGRAYITEGDTNVDVSDVNEEVNILLGKTSK